MCIRPFCSVHEYYFDFVLSFDSVIFEIITLSFTCTLFLQYYVADIIYLLLKIQYKMNESKIICKHLFWMIHFISYACVILGSIINYSCHWQKIGVWIPTKEKKSGCESWLSTMYSDPHVSLSKEIRVILNECISLIISIRLPWACGISWKSVFTSQFYVKKNVKKS